MVAPDGRKLLRIEARNAETPIEKKLVLGIMHRSGHKNFEEASEQQIENLKAGSLALRKNSRISVS